MTRPEMMDPVLLLSVMISRSRIKFQACTAHAIHGSVSELPFQSLFMGFGLRLMVFKFLDLRYTHFRKVPT